MQHFYAWNEIWLSSYIFVEFNKLSRYFVNILLCNSYVYSDKILNVSKKLIPDTLHYYF